MPRCDDNFCEYVKPNGYRCLKPIDNPNEKFCLLHRDIVCASIEIEQDDFVTIAGNVNLTPKIREQYIAELKACFYESVQYLGYSETMNTIADILKVLSSRAFIK